MSLEVVNTTYKENFIAINYKFKSHYGILAYKEYNDDTLLNVQVIDFYNTNNNLYLVDYTYDDLVKFVENKHSLEIVENLFKKIAKYDQQIEDLENKRFDTKKVAKFI